MDSSSLETPNERRGWICNEQVDSREDTLRDRYDSAEDPGDSERSLFSVFSEMLRRE